MGRIHGYCGPMFSGKSTLLIDQLRRAEIAGKRVICFKASLDNRYAADQVCTHTRQTMEARPTPPTTIGAAAIGRLSRSYDVIGVDEVQFFPATIVDEFLELRAMGKVVLWAGLDMDFLGLPFGPVPTLMAVGGVSKLFAVCHSCGDMQATHTYRVDKSRSEQVLVAGLDGYQARCYACWAKNS